MCTADIIYALPGFPSPLPQHVSQSLLFPSCLCFLCVMMILKVFLQTLFSKNQLVARYQHQSVPTVLYLTHTDTFHSCSRTLLSSRLISGLPAWHFISDPIFTAPLSFSQETDSSQIKQFLQTTIHIDLVLGRQKRKLKLST